MSIFRMSNFMQLWLQRSVEWIQGCSGLWKIILLCFPFHRGMSPTARMGSWSVRGLSPHQADTGSSSVLLLERERVLHYM